MSEDPTKKPSADDSAKLTSILTTVQAMEVRFQQLEQRVAERLYDTRPIGEKVVAHIAQLQESQQRLEEGQTALNADVREIRTSQRDGLRRMSLLHERFSQCRPTIAIFTIAYVGLRLIATRRIHQLDAPPSISYTAKRSDYSGRGVESICSQLFMKGVSTLKTFASQSSLVVGMS